MSRITKSAVAVVTALTCAGLGYAPRAAAVGTTFNYLTQQGRLLDETGAPVDGIQLTFTFALYTVATGGSSVWTEVQTITPDKGYFSAELGDVKAIDPTIFDPSKQYFLGIQVGTDTEMAPRQAITSVPFAINAKFADVANSATTATNADKATHATTADSATSAGTATSATSATHASTADTATTAGHATSADNVVTIQNLFSAGTATNGTTTATAACASGTVATGGGCLGNAALTVSTFTGAKGSTTPTGYQCSCPSCTSLSVQAACVK